jgi:hypothetical protein
VFGAAGVGLVPEERAEEHGNVFAVRELERELCPAAS